MINMQTINTMTIVISRVAYAGFPQSDADPEPRTLVLPAFPIPRSFEWMLVHGSSMDLGTEESIRDGDAIQVDRSDLEPRAGKVFVIQVAGLGNVVKRVRFIDGLYWLCSDNPDFEDFRADEATIFGRVARIVRMLDV